MCMCVCVFVRVLIICLCICGNMCMCVCSVRRCVSVGGKFCIFKLKSPKKAKN